MRLAPALLVAASLGAQESTLRAGLASVDITPSGSVPMYGYANRRCGPSNGTHDPLYAKALVLESGGGKVAIVALDLGSISSQRVVAEIRDGLGIPTVLLAASHTHSGPQPLEPQAEAGIVEAVRRASQSMFPARLAVGRGSLQLGYNRLLLRDSGRARAVFNNMERIPYGPLDPEFVVLRVDDESGKPRAVVTHYAVHAVVLGPTNCKISADYPGAMHARIERDLPGVQSMFVQGGAGDINPLFLARSGKEEDDFAMVRTMGETLGEAVAKATLAATPISSRHPIAAKLDTLRLADRWDKDKSIEVGLATVLINREIAIAATPGEPLHKLQVEWKRRADVPHALFYGYTFSGAGVWPGYIPDLRSAAYGGYGADASTRVEVGAGEAIVQRHLVNLFGLRGMWRDKPGEP
jgi:hypothetical protein